MRPVVPGALLLAGFGATNQAVARALLARGHRVVVVDDRPTEALAAVAEGIGVDLVGALSPDELAAHVAAADGVVPGPGVADSHPVFALAATKRRPIFTEFDLAQAWDDRPIAAVTGTDGKTTVTAMVAAMLTRSGIRATEAGNNDLPLVAAIDDPHSEWFVVEASSFRLGRTHAWSPTVATWLNFAPDHLDVHASAADYEAAKARIWATQCADGVAVGNLDDAVVAARLRAAPGRATTFSVADSSADYRVDGADLVGPTGPIASVGDLPRTLPHDKANALAAAATAMAAGATTDAVRGVLTSFEQLPHRVAPVATVDGVTFYDDSKATVPHATLAAVAGFDSVVLIAGGRNKGLDLTSLAAGADRIRSVIAIGEDATDVVAAFDGIRPTQVATSMAEAVGLAAAEAQRGDVVLLSPACASFDWYQGYGARGDDFAAEVRKLEENQ